MTSDENDDYFYMSKFQLAVLAEQGDKTARFELDRREAKRMTLKELKRVARQKIKTNPAARAARDEIIERARAAMHDDEQREAEPEPAPREETEIDRLYRELLQAAERYLPPRRGDAGP